ncbi:MAG: carboxypeptidase-like regulatory domain-containing protein, partial [Acidobacteriota bacterium]|nr:carboxypeptidase-like regulatory domain-containing protein [Acidobacteriota bacterium]
MLGLAGSAWPQQSERASLTVQVKSDKDELVAGADVAVHSASGTARSQKSDVKGETLFEDLAPGEYSIEISAVGYGGIATQVVLQAGAGNRVDAALSAVTSRTDAITVTDTIPLALEQGASVPMTLRREDVKNLPDRPGSVADALPMAPDIIRLPNGQLRLSGGGEQRGTMLVNSANVTDPATGQFGATIPIDSVSTMNVLSSPFLAEYGGFTSDVVSVETRRAGQRWSFELNDPLPEFRFRSWHMRGLRSATPRLSFGGPILRDRLYLMESLQYE